MTYKPILSRRRRQQLRQIRQKACNGGSMTVNVISDNSKKSVSASAASGTREPKDKVVIIARNCILCCRPAQPRRKLWNNVKFLLEEVVPYSPIPESQFHHEEVEGRIYLCSSCHKLLGLGQQIQTKIIQWEKELEKLKRDLKVMVDGSVLIKTEDDDKEEFDLYVNIREQLLTDFVREEEKSNDQSNQMAGYKSEWRGLDFGGYNNDDDDNEQLENQDQNRILAFSGEIGADPLELDSISQIETTEISLENLDISQTTRQSLLQDNLNLQAFHEFNEGRVLTTYSKVVPKRDVSQVNAQMEATLRERKKRKVITKKLPTVTPYVLDKQIVETAGLVGGDTESRLKSTPILDSSTPSPQTGILPSVLLWTKVLKAGRDDNSPITKDQDVRWVQEDALIRGKNRKGIYQCKICPDTLASAIDAQLHRKFMHPGLAVCVSPILSLQCGKIFKSKDIRRHRKESHPLLRCPDCVESFSSEKGRDLHLKKVHYPDSSPPTLPDCGYDVKLIPWVNPLSEEEVKVVTWDQRSLCLEIERVKTKIDDHIANDASDWAKTDTGVLLNDGHAVKTHTGAESPRTDNQTKEGMGTSIVSFKDIAGKILGHSDQSESNNSSTNLIQDESVSNSNLPPVTTKPHTSTPDVIESEETAPKTNINQTLTANNPSPAHLAKVKPKKPKKILYNCGICSTKFPVQSDLLQHLQDVHNQKMKFGCFICHQEFASLPECEAHIFQKHPGTSSSATPAAIKSFSQALSPPSPTHIKPFTRMDNFNKWPFSCLPCRIRFATLTVLKAHLKSKDHSLTIQHGPVQVCPRKGCKHKYRGVENLASHIATRHKEQQKCPDCRRKYEDTDTLTRHRVRFHNFIPPEPLPPLIFTCNIANCEKTFSMKYAHVRHLFYVHNVGETEFNCTQCDKRFMNERRLADHVKYLHDKVPGPYTCGTCGKHFMTRDKLNYHTAIHLEDRPFLCSECGKAFKTRVSLTIHNYGHDPDRYTKHYPYRIQVQKRLETQKRKEAAKMTDNMASNSRSSKKGCKRSDSNQIATDPPVTISLPISIDQQQFPVPENVVHFNGFMGL